jgi:hypothetical protein
LLKCWPFTGPMGSNPIPSSGDIMKTRQPRKGELNHKLQHIVLKTFNRTGSAIDALPLIQLELRKLSKKWNVTESVVNYDVELIPGKSRFPGSYRPFVEFVKVEAYRRRPNRTIAEHKVCLCFWPFGYKGIEKNPIVSSIVNDPWVEVSVPR